MQQLRTRKRLDLHLQSNRLLRTAAVGLKLGKRKHHLGTNFIAYDTDTCGAKKGGAVNEYPPHTHPGPTFKKRSTAP